MPPDSDPALTGEQSDVAKLARSKRFFGRAAFVCGLCVVVPPLFGLIGTVKGMLGAFAQLEQTGSTDPAALAGDISVAVLTTFWGLAFSVLSAGPFIVFLILYFRRSRLLRGFQNRDGENAEKLKS